MTDLSCPFIEGTIGKELQVAWSDIVLSHAWPKTTFSSKSASRNQKVLLCWFIYYLKLLVCERAEFEHYIVLSRIGVVFHVVIRFSIQDNLYLLLFNLDNQSDHAILFNVMN